MTVSTSPHSVLDPYAGSADGRRPPRTAPFDGSARHYDRVGRSIHLGSGPWYRRQALRRAGLHLGMKLLDVATGTGLLAQEAVRILGEAGKVVGVDPSAPMLAEARKALASPLARGWAEALPFRPDVFDMLSMGYALCHLAELNAIIRECLRVLKPGGRLVMLELARPESAAVRWLVRVHLQQVLPRLVHRGAGSQHARLLMAHLWDTIDRRVPPETVLQVLRRSGFVDVEHRVLYGLFSEYGAMKPASAGTAGRQRVNG
jgi:demethylmenaquinone methyltransferase/2-methoxy-6-polyprenyl-1,4-benzoquinol methylase